MELQDIPKGSKINVDTDKGKMMITFFHCDGLYSYCEDKDKNPCHLSRTTPLKKVKDYYEIDDEKDE